MNLQDASQNWLRLLKSALDAESWGQGLDAVEIYSRISQSILNTPRDVLSSSQIRSMSRLLYAVKTRADQLECMTIVSSTPTRQEMQSLEQFITSIAKNPELEFPFKIPESADDLIESSNKIVTSNIDSSDDDDSSSTSETHTKHGDNAKTKKQVSVIKAVSKTANLLPPPSKLPNQNFPMITLQKIGLKDAARVNEIYLTISCKDKAGLDIEPIQETASTSHIDDKHFIFDQVVHFQKSHEQFPRDGAIFFEVKYFKKTLAKVKCFAFLEKDEFKPGPLVLELYSKPTDFRRKKLSLLTKKPLYLHIEFALY